MYCSYEKYITGVVINFSLLPDNKLQYTQDIENKRKKVTRNAHGSTNLQVNINDLFSHMTINTKSWRKVK